MKKNYLKRSALLIALMACAISLNSCADDSFLNEVQGNTSSLSPKENTNIRVLSHNVFLLTENLLASTTQWSQFDRANLIGNANYLKDYDVLLLQECFDNNASNALKEKLSTTFPYQTPVIGRSKSTWDKTDGNWREVTSGGIEDGGVMIASKYPIEYMSQYIFPTGCDFDALSLKGFAYARILKNGKRFHFVSTHLQSTQPGCNGNEVNIRKNQLNLIKQYIDDLDIPSDEMVVYGGDFNVIKGTSEYNEMFDLLHVSEPHYSGASYTWDTKANTMANYHYPYPANAREYLDYIFVSNDHLKPSLWQNMVLDPVSSELQSNANMVNTKYYWVDYSDHYPVAGFVQANTTTPKSSMKYRKYDYMSFKSVLTKKYISTDLSNPTDWLKVTNDNSNLSTMFNVINIDQTDYYKLKSGKIRVESSERINNFWYWNLVSANPYWYYSNFGKSLDRLELVIVKKNNNSTSEQVEDGDIIAFKDYASKAYYLKVVNYSGVDYIYLNGQLTDPAVQFEVHLNNVPKNWERGQPLY
ncbi:sphingomyelin phosphodiesterase [Flavobacterium sp. '19STA2R22 D10 B1']|uniref:sphingomyelin phosphodiesterase n=1 Tax=Flavobacterium aerium TaxID=3037261 RepID=UPI00278BC009|nr:sphingomyelin phosphodiesterase [Flavobacterium sp. '19STA2R22 D10 B1']